MYTAHKHLQILISLLKQHDITHLVLSPGARSIPFVRSVENDDDFICYSVVDERSAAFFAMGLSLELRKPVAVACTSATATCNYYSAVVEASYQGVPLLLLTFDRDPYLLDQMENQMINQTKMYGVYCKASVNLPIVKDDRDFMYCQRIANEAMLELRHRGQGPVQINIPIFGIDLFNVSKLPEVRKISRLVAGTQKADWYKAKEYLESKERVMFVVGQNDKLSKVEADLLDKFCLSYDCVVVGEHMSNINSQYSLRIYGFAEVLSTDKFAEYQPDIVISFGGNVSGRLKDLLRSRPGSIEHWSIREDGKIVDSFYNISCVFESTLEYFLKEMLIERRVQKHAYYERWKHAVEVTRPEEVEFSNFYVAKCLAEKIESNAVIHSGILNSTRQLNFFDIERETEYRSNIGAFGIDGTLSTFLGQSVATDKKCYLLLGDLSFLYDMNAISIRHIKDNVRIVVVNNGGGGEFHYVMGKDKIPTINRHISAGHNHSIKGWVESLGIKYFTANTKESFDRTFQEFLKWNEGVAIMEVFTEMENDAAITKRVISELRIETASEKIQRSGMNLARNLLHTWQNKGVKKDE